MISNQTFAPVERSGDFKEMELGINAEGMPYILDIISNKLYTDKIAAPLREISCNSADAHVDAGIEEPIVVSLPTALDCYLRIRDFGKGMSEDEIYTIFRFYGSSTKRKSNSFTGMMGIGSKSPFCYSDSFVVTSINGGEKKIYNIFKNESGTGSVAKIASEPCNERSGIEICIPVRESDIENFHSKAEKVFRFFKIKPTIKSSIRNVIFSSIKPILSGDDWQYHGRFAESVAIMGNVGYEMKADSFTNQLTPEEKLLVRAGINIEFNIGDLQVSANREGLEYKDKTILSIKAKLQQILASMVDTMKQGVETSGNIYQAKEAYGRYQKNEFLRELVSQRSISFTFNGEEISSSAIKLDQTLIGSVAVFYKRAKKRSSSLMTVLGQASMIDCGENNVFYLCDIKGSAMGRARQVFEDNPHLNRIYVFKFHNEESKDVLLKTTSLDYKTFGSLKDINFIPTFHHTGGGGPRNDIFELNPLGLGRHRLRDLKSHCWNAVDFSTLNGGVYLTLSSMCPRINGYTNNSYDVLGAIHNALVGLKIKVPTIYGIKDYWQEKHELDKGWIRLDEWVEEKMSNSLSVQRVQDNYNNLLTYFSLSNDNSLKELLKYKTELSPSSTLFKFLDKIDETTLEYNDVHKYFQHIVALQRHLGLKILKQTEQSEIQILRQEVKKKYEMMEFYKEHDYDIPRYAPMIIRYANIVDKAELA